ncbi:outer membrane protein [Sulfitobacter sabulilitoris]|uniref:Porin family protein n=1 Tax=Sulfitobacter sabulilitoris TaxID=2562655 RepID=A0A5S3PKA7_9RHOB|nr:outer membrane beta-barrel protein [Sulfitobacter sabulilitoris]TMM54854.1 porin family protein [Sulfitobacter sabulilitoris]
MKKTWTYAAAAAVAATTSVPAFAGTLAEPIVDAPPPAPVVVQNVGGEWGGFYGGLQLGYADVSGDDALDGVEGDNGTYGLHLGYNYDFGQWVVGGELDYDKLDVDLEAGGAPIGQTVDDVTRLKLKAGYDLGRSMVYATAGAARVNTTVGDDTGAFLGLGYSYQLTDQFVMTGEYLHHEFSDLGDNAGFDADADTFTVRASFRF